MNFINEERILGIFKQTGVLMEGHFLLTSGRHSDQYLQCAKVFRYPEYTEELSIALSKHFKNLKIDIVIGPAIGGIIFAYEMARCLNAKAMFAERQEGNMVLRRGFYIPEGANILIVEDVITTGGSVKEVIELVKGYKSNVAGVATLVDRSNGTVEFGAEYRAAITLDVKSYTPENCPICKSDIPLVKPGSRSFLR